MVRVFVTGIGIVSPIGNTREEYWQSLLAGRPGIRSIQNINVEDLPVKIAGEVDGLDFSAANVNDKVSVKRMDRSTVFAVIAAGEALRDAGLNPTELGLRCGTIIGSGLSGMAVMEEQTHNCLTKGPRQVSVFTIPMIMSNGPPANISLAYDILGPCFTTSSACASSGHSIIAAFEAIRRGQLDAVVTGGTESPIMRLAIAAFSNMKALTKKFNDHPSEASRPFDAGRDGFVMAEGASILILESEEHIRKRGGKAYAEVIGYGDTADSHHLVAPDPEGTGAAKAIQYAFEMAGLNPAEVADKTYVNAHGTSTKLNDAAESAALKKVFGQSAKKLQISSTKSMTGHLIGAAGGIEAAACALALQQGKLPPTVNYETPDPECDLDYIPNVARETGVEYALNDSFGFGGHNTTVLFKRVG